MSPGPLGPIEVVVLAFPENRVTEGGDLMSELEKLGQMRTAGLLDDAEFAAAKAKLLG